MRERWKEGAKTAVFVVGVVAAILAYEAITGDTVERSEIQFVQALVFFAVVLAIFGLGAYAAVSGGLPGRFRAMAERKEWARLTRTLLLYASVPFGLAVGALAVVAADAPLPEASWAAFCAWGVVAILPAIVMIVADEPAYGMADQTKLGNRLLGRTLIPIVVATLFFLAAIAASPFGAFGLMVDAVAVIGIAASAVLGLTLALFSWPQRLLFRQLRRGATEDERTRRYESSAW